MDGNNSTDCVQQDDQEVIELIFGGTRLSGPNPNILSSRWASSSSTSTPYLIFSLSKYVDPQRSDAHLRASPQEKQNVTMYICTILRMYVYVRASTGTQAWQAWRWMMTKFARDDRVE